MDLQKIESLFYQNAQDFDELGTALSIWQDGRERLSLTLGFGDRERTRPWTEETLVPVWSCTKGPASATLHLALESADCQLSDKVAKVWPAFANGGKETITFQQLLSHGAGLAALDERVEMTDHAAVIVALESQVPLWPSGEGHGYHPRTYGFLLDECVRKLTGAGSLGDYWREELADPLGFDIWIGLPESEHARVASVYPGPLGESNAEENAFYQAFSDSNSITKRAFTSPSGLNAVADMNQPKVWQAGYPAMGGLASAHGLAAFYSVLAHEGVCEGHAFFSPGTMAAMQTPHFSGQRIACSCERQLSPLDS